MTVLNEAGELLGPAMHSAESIVDEDRRVEEVRAHARFRPPRGEPALSLGAEPVDPARAPPAFSSG